MIETRGPRFSTHWRGNEPIVVSQFRQIISLNIVLYRL